MNLSSLFYNLLSVCISLDILKLILDVYDRGHDWIFCHAPATPIGVWSFGWFGVLQHKMRKTSFKTRQTRNI